ncbi:hypothetical protein L2Y96_09090 [Luteibacter aegosomaticola]|jgi:hypothetical protein|uniref:hypothetical protein n=1 Tax=Luteibacter aegosomaticola TaxID=2911538 RepID=UPI001FFC07D0|nr:hypothetical protein [Luteibacter aegosomaticola]UPG91903.1 hypothetical protein L2Y96_09090 [Luteibacter aegosomaticola]
MASRSSLSDHLDTTHAQALPDGCMPGHVAPFVMRYGVDFLVAMQRAAGPKANTRAAEEAEPA